MLLIRYLVAFLFSAMVLISSNTGSVTVLPTILLARALDEPPIWTLNRGYSLQSQQLSVSNVSRFHTLPPPSGGRQGSTFRNATLHFQLLSMMQATNRSRIVDIVLDSVKFENGAVLLLTAGPELQQQQTATSSPGSSNNGYTPLVRIRLRNCHFSDSFVVLGNTSFASLGLHDTRWDVLFERNTFTRKANFLSTPDGAVEANAVKLGLQSVADRVGADNATVHTVGGGLITIDSARWRNALVSITSNVFSCPAVTRSSGPLDSSQPATVFGCAALSLSGAVGLEQGAKLSFTGNSVTFVRPQYVALLAVLPSGNLTVTRDSLWQMEDTTMSLKSTSTSSSSTALGTTGAPTAAGLHLHPRSSLKVFHSSVLQFTKSSLKLQVHSPSGNASFLLAPSANTISLKNRSFVAVVSCNVSVEGAGGGSASGISVLSGGTLKLYNGSQLVLSNDRWTLSSSSIGVVSGLRFSNKTMLTVSNQSAILVNNSVWTINSTGGLACVVCHEDGSNATVTDSSKYTFTGLTVNITGQASSNSVLHQGNPLHFTSSALTVTNSSEYSVLSGTYNTTVSGAKSDSSLLHSQMSSITVEQQSYLRIEGLSFAAKSGKLANLMYIISTSVMVRGFSGLRVANLTATLFSNQNVRFIVAFRGDIASCTFSFLNNSYFLQTGLTASLENTNTKGKAIFFGIGGGVTLRLDGASRMVLNDSSVSVKSPITSAFVSFYNGSAVKIEGASRWAFSQVQFRNHLSADVIKNTNSLVMSSDSRVTFSQVSVQVVNAESAVLQWFADGQYTGPQNIPVFLNRCNKVNKGTSVLALSAKSNNGTNLWWSTDGCETCYRGLDCAYAYTTSASVVGTAPRGCQCPCTTGHLFTLESKNCWPVMEPSSLASLPTNLSVGLSVLPSLPAQWAGLPTTATPTKSRSAPTTTASTSMSKGTVSQSSTEPKTPTTASPPTSTDSPPIPTCAPFGGTPTPMRLPALPPVQVIPSGIIEDSVRSGTAILLVVNETKPSAAAAATWPWLWNWYVEQLPTVLSTRAGTLILTVAAGGRQSHSPLIPNNDGFSRQTPNGTLTLLPPNTTDSTYNWTLELEPLPQYSLYEQEELEVWIAGVALPIPDRSQSPNCNESTTESPVQFRWPVKAIHFATVRVIPAPAPDTSAQKATTAVTSIAMVASAAVGGTVAVDAQALVALSFLECAAPAERSSTKKYRLLAPLALEDSFKGMVLGNLLLVFGVLLLQGFGVFVCRLAYKTATFTACVKLFFPSLFVNITVLSFQGLGFAAFRLLLDPSEEDNTVDNRLIGAVGAVFVLVLLAVPIVLVRKWCAMTYSRYIWDWKLHLKRRHLLRWLLPRERWTPPEMKRIIGLHASYGSRNKNIVLFPFLLPSLFIAVGCWRPAKLSGCVVQMYALAFGVFVVFLLIIWKKPFRGWIYNLLAAVSLFSIVGATLSSALIAQAGSATPSLTKILGGFTMLQTAVTCARIVYIIGVSLAERTLSGYTFDPVFCWVPGPVCGDHRWREGEAPPEIMERWSEAPQRKLLGDAEETEPVFEEVGDTGYGFASDGTLEERRGGLEAGLLRVPDGAAPREAAESSPNSMRGSKAGPPLATATAVTDETVAPLSLPATVEEDLPVRATGSKRRPSTTAKEGAAAIEMQIAQMDTVGRKKDSAFPPVRHSTLTKLPDILACLPAPSHERIQQQAREREEAAARAQEELEMDDFLKPAESVSSMKLNPVTGEMEVNEAAFARPKAHVLAVDEEWATPSARHLERYAILGLEDPRVKRSRTTCGSSGASKRADEKPMDDELDAPPPDFEAEFAKPKEKPVEPEFDDSYFATPRKKKTKATPIATATTAATGESKQKEDASKDRERHPLADATAYLRTLFLS